MLFALIPEPSTAIVLPLFSIAVLCAIVSIPFANPLTIVIPDLLNPDVIIGVICSP